jgi:membrane protein
MGSHEPDPGTPQSLAELLSELTNRPVGDRRSDRLRARAVAFAERTTSSARLKPVAEIGWLALRRDAAVGGNVLACALAYRIFIWLLPLALVLVLGLGLLAGSTADAAAVLGDAGVTGFLATSVSTAAEQTKGWALVTGFVVGLVVLVYQSYALLRAARAVTALAWRLPVRPPANPPRATFLFLAWMLAFTVIAASLTALRANLGQPVELLTIVASYVVLPALWVALSWWLLPHAAEHWTHLLPGGIVVGTAMTLTSLFNALLLFPWLARQEETYGVLGVAAGLLFTFFLIGRAIELAAALNAVVNEQRQANTLAA